MSGARGADQRGLPSLDAARQVLVSIVDLPFAIGAAGAGAIGLIVGFQHTEDASVLPIRMAGALLTGFVAGLVGRGRQGWISATLGASLALLCLAWLSSEPGVVELVALPVFFISLLALAPGYGLSILGPMIAFGFFYSFAGSDEPEAAVASGISIFVGSFVAAGLCCAVDGRGIRGALQTLVIPVAGVALLVLATLGALAEGGSAYGALEWLRTIALAFLVVAVPIEFGYLVGRFVAWLRRMRGGPTVTPTSARGPSEMVEEKP